MRTNIGIDSGLLRSAMRATGLKTERAAVEEALRLVILQGQTSIRKLRGKVEWVGDLNAMRRDRFTR